MDVVSDAAAVRRQIGVTAQDATLDELLTGRQNLVMVGELRGLRRSSAKARAVELLERFELTDAADRIMKGYSGGMRRRLDLAAGLVTRPPVLFLDEPTTGLDPTSRLRMWEVIRELVAEGATLLLTTQYLEEADELADRIVVIDHGTVIAEGTSAELKAATGGARLTVTLAAPHPRARDALEPYVDGPIHVSQDDRRFQAAVRSTSGLATTVVRALDAAGAARRRRRGAPAVARRRLLLAHRPRHDRQRGRRQRSWSPSGRERRYDRPGRAVAGAHGGRRTGAGLRRRVHDVVVLTRRNLVHITREPLQLSDVTVQPVLFTLLFIYVFGSGVPIRGAAIRTSPSPG